MGVNELFLTDIPLSCFNNLAREIEVNDVWKSCMRKCPDVLSSDVQYVSRKDEPGRSALEQLAQYGVTVGQFKDILKQLQLERALLCFTGEYACQFEPPRILTAPDPSLLHDYLEGESFQFPIIVSADGFPLPRYEWQKYDAADDSFKLIPGLVSPDLAIRILRVEDSGVYRCVVSNINPADSQTYFCTSDVIFLRVNPRGPRQPSVKIVRNPASCNVSFNGCASLVCEAETECEPLRFQWFRNSEVVIGTNFLQTDIDFQSKLEIIQVIDTSVCGKYQCLVTDALGCPVLSETAVISVAPLREGLGFAADKYALLIGNLEYPKDIRLFGPETDVFEMKQLFGEMGFKVISLLNLTHAETVSAIRRFCDLINEGCYVVFYFSGHGFEVDEQLYLVPVGVSEFKPENCIACGYVKDQIMRKRPKLSVFIFDTCRTGHEDYAPHEGNTRVRQSLSDACRGVNFIELYATSFLMESYEEVHRPEQAHHDSSVLVKYLKRYAKQERKDINEVFTDVQRNVCNDISQTNSREQKPQINHNLAEGAFCLSDPINNRLCTTELLKSVEQSKKIYAELHEYQKYTDIPVEQLDAKTIIRIYFTPALSNMLQLNIVLHPCQPLSDTCNRVRRISAILAEFSDKRQQAEHQGIGIVSHGRPRIIAAGEMTGLSVTGVNLGWAIVSNLHRLRRQMSLQLQLHYQLASYADGKPGQTRDCCVVLPVNLGLPLISKIKLWKS